MQVVCRAKGLERSQPIRRKPPLVLWPNSRPDALLSRSVRCETFRSSFSIDIVFAGYGRVAVVSSTFVGENLKYRPCVTYLISISAVPAWARAGLECIFSSVLLNYDGHSAHVSRGVGERFRTIGRVRIFYSCIVFSDFFHQVLGFCSMQRATGTPTVVGFPRKTCLVQDFCLPSHSVFVAEHS